MVSGNPRTYPFTIRISFEERGLLQRAARAARDSQANVARIGLEPLFESLRVAKTLIP